jgi:hypothetical protein
MGVTGGSMWNAPSSKRRITSFVNNAQIKNHFRGVTHKWYLNS